MLFPWAATSSAVDNSGNTDNGTTTDWGVNGIDLTGDGNLDVALVGVEKATDFASTGTAPVTGTNTGDTVNAGGSTATGRPVPDGHHDRLDRRASPPIST